MTQLHPKHPRLIRWTHWLNVPLLAVMALSGLYIYWAYPTYRIGLGDLTLVPMNLNSEAWRTLGVNNHLARGMAIHFVFGWLFVANGLLYLLATAVSGQWRGLLPRRGSLGHAWRTLLHDLHLRDAPPEHGKYNGAQRLTYTLVALMGVGAVATGLAIYKPVQLGWLTAVLGGYVFARFLHFWIAVGFVLFLVVHLVQVARAGWNNLRAMIIGAEVVDEPAERQGGAG